MRGIVVGGGAGGATDPKGSTSIPVYFDSEGEVQEVTSLGNSDKKLNLTGNAETATKTVTTCTAGSSVVLVEASGSTDGCQFKYGCGTADDGWLEISTYDNGTEPIYCKQYSAGSVAHTLTLMDGSGYSSFLRAYNAVWNDYAEFREGSGNPGQCVCEDLNGVVSPSTKRLQKCPNLISDTFGYIMGKQSESTVALAVSGRVLAYPDKNNLKVGDVVCSGKNGTVSKMSRLEIILFPDRILGVVCELPTYETWGTDNVKVNGRIWIKVK